jgi:hypothetical protein
MQFNPNVYNHHASENLGAKNTSGSLNLNPKLLDFIDTEILSNIIRINEQVDILSKNICAVCTPTLSTSGVSNEITGLELYENSSTSVLRNQLMHVNRRLNDLYKKINDLNATVDII